jgi:hypothetical protein
MLATPYRCAKSMTKGDSMRRVKAMLFSLTIILALAFVFQPTQALASDPGGPQGTTETKPKPPPLPPEVIAVLLRLLGLL